MREEAPWTFLKSTFSASNGLTTLPTAWIACAVRRRISAKSDGPHRARKGFAAVSRTDRPVATTKLETMNPGNETKTADGQNIRVPVPYMQRPVIKHALKPPFFKTH